MELDSLEGVGPVTKQKLHEAGIYSIMDLAARGVGEVADSINGDTAKASELINKARTKLSDLGVLAKDFVSARELFQKRQSIERVSTGSKNLDTLLGGGVETGAVTEFYGEFGSGKSQICHTLAVMVQESKEKGGLSAGALYVDTEGTFRPERIAEIAEARGTDPGKVLDNIIVAKAYNSAHQELIVREVGRQIERTKLKLVVVDSAVAHYRAEFLGRGTLAERQQRLNRFMHMLVRDAEVYGVVVVVTNQVQSSPDFFFGDPTRATGGHVVAHTSTYRLYLRKASKSRIARMVDSPYHPEGEAVFVINSKGVDDPSEDSPRKRSGS
ncbi:MAG: DNA repair and recombination protein RadA [Nitrososphaerota archaeon]|nr:DNA repair and recombination protein RadA [Nitrososphaerota archaeon]MDG6939442.1 DNA repair and recombination protein RadA [Nitrososphaerota archaeon]